MMYGATPVRRRWRDNLVVKGVLVTDAKSLYDHLQKCGGIPRERQVLLDLLSVRNAVEAQQVFIRWVPTERQLADPLTKSMVLAAFDIMYKQNEWSLIPTEVEQAEQEHKKALRRAQRERRKARFEHQKAGPDKT